MKLRIIKFFTFILSIISILGILSACEIVNAPTHTHVWEEATCISPKKCKECNQVDGEPLGHHGGTATCEHKAICETCGLEYGELENHNWEVATCTTPKTCKVCKATEGVALSHQGGIADCSHQAICEACNQPYGELGAHVWEKATCTTPKTCKVCKITEGVALGHHGGVASCDQKAICEVCNQEYGELKEHDWEAATCTAPKTCKVCKVTEGAALGHHGGVASCDHKAICEVCNQEYGELKEHNWEAATCITSKKCKECGQVDGEPLGHHGGTATCEHKAVCETCDLEYGEYGEHTWEDATCTTPKTCKVCKVTEGTAVEHHGGTADCSHQAVCEDCGQAYGNLGEHVWEAATCTTPKTCKVCGETEGVAISHHGGTADCSHQAICEDCGLAYGDLGNHVWEEATCTTPKTCKVCKVTEGAALGHHGGTADCSHKAICEDCSQEYGDYGNHQLMKTAAKEATCTVQGNIEYWTCSICNKYYSNQEASQEIKKDSWIIEMVDHSGGHADCSHKAICEVCGQSYGELGAHDWVAATCTEPKTCNICKATEGAALGHHGGTATCEHKAVCETCGLEYGELGAHDWEAVTCITPKTCKVCKVTEGEPLGHHGGTATCQKKAICETCGLEYGELGDHVWVDITDGKQCEICNEVVSNVQLPIDITDKATITDSMVTIPFGAITATGIYKITTNSGTIEINWSGYDGTAETYSEFGINGSSSITFTMENETIYKLESDIYEYNNVQYNNMQLYKGSSSSGVLIDSTAVNLGSKTGNKYTYIIDGGATELYYYNNYTNSVKFYDIYLYTKEDSEPINPDIPQGIVENIVYDDFQIHFLELGNDSAGDSVYIKAGGNDILIDAGSKGESATTLYGYINQYCTDGILEYVIVTHSDTDHIAGMYGNSLKTAKNHKDEVVGRTGLMYYYDIKNIIDFAFAKGSEAIDNSTATSTSVGTTTNYGKYLAAREYAVSKGASYYCVDDCWNNSNGGQRTYQLTENISMNILYNAYYFESSSDNNNYSVCTLFSYNDHHFMLTGDLEKEGEQKLADYYDGSTAEKILPHCDLFKGGHHGSKTSSNDCLLSKITPSICCVCCCAGSSEYTANYKNMFPTQEFIDRIAKYTDRVYITSLFNEETLTNESMNGNIIVSCNGQTIGLQATNNLTKLKDTTWFNETIYVVGENHCSGAKKEDFYTSTTTDAVPVVRRIWPNLE